jgi:ABC-type lipoprotein release transport system permease subunit
MTLAYHNLLQDKARSLLSIIGVGLTIMLILILNGFLNGVYQSAATYLANEPGSVVVARQDVKNFIVAGSLLAPGTADAVGKTKGVGRVIPLLTQAVYVEQRGQKRFIELVGYDSRLGGGPWNLVAGIISIKRGGEGCVAGHEKYGPTRA